MSMTIQEKSNIHVKIVVLQRGLGTLIYQPYKVDFEI